MEEMKAKLKADVGEKRFEHSLRVMEEAKKLAHVYDVEAESAAIAGLLHDCGRYQDKSTLLKNAAEFDIILDSMYAKNVGLIHAYLGMEVAKVEYGIKDEAVLNAIKYHTTGRESMSMLEKVVYMADYIEPSRSFEGIEAIRDICYVEKDINKALVKAIDNTIIYILNAGGIIHEDTIKARNYLVFNM